MRPSSVEHKRATWPRPRYEGWGNPFRFTATPFQDYPGNFRASTDPSTMQTLRISEGESRMGERVTPSQGEDRARAQRLKRALASGAPPAFVQAPRNTVSPANGDCSTNSCPVPPYIESKLRPATAQLEFLQQIFHASPDGLAISDCEHR